MYEESSFILSIHFVDRFRHGVNEMCRGTNAIAEAEAIARAESRDIDDNLMYYFAIT